MRKPDQLSHADLVEFVAWVQSWFFWDEDGWTLDKELSGADTIEFLISELSGLDLVPDDFP